jgi:RNA polymerase-binding transcription factor DksA
VDLFAQRRRLTAILSRLERRLDFSVDSGKNIRDYHHELSVVDNHPADVASEDYLRNLDASFQENDLLLIEKTQQAIARIDSGEYEHCTECGARISTERLHALPYASTCEECAKTETKAPGKSRSYPDHGEFTWPRFNQYGTSESVQDRPLPGRDQ